MPTCETPAMSRSSSGFADTAVRLAHAAGMPTRLPVTLIQGPVGIGPESMIPPSPPVPDEEDVPPSVPAFDEIGMTHPCSDASEEMQTARIAPRQEIIFVLAWLLPSTAARGHPREAAERPLQSFRIGARTVSER